MASFSVSKPVYKTDEAGEFILDESGKKVLDMDKSRAIDLEYNFGETIEEAVGMFGADIVLSNFTDGAVLDVQAIARRMLAAKNEDGSDKHTDQEIVDFVASWKPGVKVAREKDPLAKIKKILAGLTEDQKAKLKDGGIESLVDLLG